MKYILYIPFCLCAEVTEDNFMKLSPYLDSTFEEFKAEIGNDNDYLEYYIQDAALKDAILHGNVLISENLLNEDWAKYANINKDGFDSSMVTICPTYAYPNYLTFNITINDSANVNIEDIKKYILMQMSDGIGEGDQGKCIVNGETLYIQFENEIFEDYEK